MSREAAAECSPGRKPGDRSAILISEPAKRATVDLKRNESLGRRNPSVVCRPSGAASLFLIVIPRAYALGLLPAAASRLVEPPTLEL